MASTRRQVANLPDQLDIPVPPDPFDPDPTKVPTFYATWSEDLEYNGVDCLCLGLENGDVLTRYQTWDTMDIFRGFHERYIGLQCREDAIIQKGAQGVILHYEMGLGKTHVACVVPYLSRIFRRALLEDFGMVESELKPDLIIAPVSVHRQWLEHIERITGGRMKAVVFDGKKGKSLDGTAHVVIASMSIYLNHLKQYSDALVEIHTKAIEISSSNRRPPLTFAQAKEGLLEECRNGFLSEDAELALPQWNYLVIDECHAGLANPVTLSILAALSANFDNGLLLTGTVAQNKTDDWQVPLNLGMEHSSRRGLDTCATEQNASARVPESEEKLSNFKDLEPQKREIVNIFEERDVEPLFPATVCTRLVVNPQTNRLILPLPPKNVFYIAITPQPVESYFQKPNGYSSSMPPLKVLRQRQTCIDPYVALVGLAKTALGKCQKEVISREECEAFAQGFEDRTSEMRFDFDKDGDTAMPYVPSTEDIHRFIRCTHDRRQKSPLAEDDGENDEELSAEAKAILQVSEQFGIGKVLEDSFLSSKFAAMWELIHWIPKDDKMIIFSMFTAVLDQFAKFLIVNGIPFVKYDGSMSNGEREASLRAIAKDKSKQIILVSMKVGGVGLNITACNHVVLLDPWWKPYVEDQAIARAYRMGQTKEVHVYHIVCPDTIEDKVNEIKKKRKTRKDIDAFTRKLALMRHEEDEAKVKQRLPWARPVDFMDVDDD